MEMEEQSLVNRYLVDQQGQWDTERNFNQQSLPGSSLNTHLVDTVVTYGDSPFLEQVLYPHSSGSSGEDQKFFRSLLGLGCFQLEIVLMPKRHFRVANFVPLK